MPKISVIFYSRGEGFMCDTMGKLLVQGRGIFAKNSDRSSNEPQVIEWHPAQLHSERMLKTTYIEVDQVKKTHAILLSRPVWLWGGEIGVNDCGVCIGNEAVFTKGSYGKSGLTGMDLLRLGLERGESAKDSLRIIIELLEHYGQGGNCGYDHSFYYDNSFLIMDKSELYILETANRKWVYRKAEYGSISNRLSIGTDGDKYSDGKVYDFKGKHMEPIYSYFSGSKKRFQQTSFCICKAESIQDIMQGMRTHSKNVQNPLTQCSVSSPCMHAGGLVGDHTTASMIVELGDTIKVWVTGSSTPCISLFKPYGFGNLPTAPIFYDGDVEAELYWHTRENFHRSLIGKILPQDYYAERDSLEESWVLMAKDADLQMMKEISYEALIEDNAFFEKWKDLIPEGTSGSKYYLSYWKKKNSQMGVINNIN